LLRIIEGTVLGTIKIGAGSAAARKAGVIGIMGNAMASDRNGNLYLADSGAGAAQYMPPVTARGGGVYLFPQASLDALAEGRDVPLSYVPTPSGGADGVEAAPDGFIQLNTVGNAAGLKDPAAGGMYKLSASDFANGTLPGPFAGTAMAANCSSSPSFRPPHRMTGRTRLPW
jgi:hypothetical protein